MKTYVAVNADTNSIKAALNGRPCSASVAGSTGTFQTYSSGIITTAACGTDSNLAVLIVGYGTDYYLVQNSWGVWWGDKGYVKIGMAEGAGVCGINQYVAYPVI